MFWTIVGFIVTGFIVGLIARALKPGDDSMSLGKTTLAGILGAFLVGLVARVMGWGGANSEGVGFLAAVVGAVAVLYIYHASTHRHGIQR